MKKVTILGATGSIGQSTIDLIRREPDAYSVVSLTAGRNVQQLAQDAVALGAKLAVIEDQSLYPQLKSALSGTGVEAACGTDAIVEAATRPADWIMSAIVGAAGLVPGWRACEQGTTLALANKESLVTAGPILMQHAREFGATILPVDSEHSAIFQALVGEDIARVERVIITASGGAFRDWPLEKLADATPEQAASHPNWDMGQRITIDSASMFNKGMELIETKELFNIPPDQIETVIHPESLIHALVGYTDGALMAHIGPHDMRHAIGYALHWPSRGQVPVDRLDLTRIGQFNFYAADPHRYPALTLAREVMQAGGMMGCVYNAAKETALDAFIARQIGFMHMADVVSRTIDMMLARDGLQNATMSLDTVLETDRLARARAAEVIGNMG